MRRRVPPQRNPQSQPITRTPVPGVLQEPHYVMTLCIPMVLGMVCTVWFIWGGLRDLIRLFRDLGARVRDASDNGFVARQPSHGKPD